LEHELGVLLNPIGRTTIDKTGEYTFPHKLVSKLPKAADHEAVRLALTSTQVAGVGIDTELISEVPSDNQAFVSRNYTSAEIAYCQKQPSPQASFAGRWAAKEVSFFLFNLPFGLRAVTDVFLSLYFSPRPSSRPSPSSPRELELR